MEVSQENEYKTYYKVEFQGETEAREALKGLEESAARLKDQLAALKEQPLDNITKGLEKPEQGAEGEGGLGGVFKDPKVVGAYTDMATKGTVHALFSRDIRGAFESLGLRFAETLIAELAAYFAKQAIFRLPGLPLPFQHEGLVRSPTLALVGERERC